jgi:hypothetical protein
MLLKFIKIYLLKKIFSNSIIKLHIDLKLIHRTSKFCELADMNKNLKN